MKKTIWTKIFACSAIIIVLVTSLLPLMVNATPNLEIDGDWSSETPDFSNYYTFDISDFSLEVIEKLTLGINDAYDGGMFGGSIPIAIIACRGDDLSTTTYIDIITLSQQANATQNSMGSKEEARESTTCTIGQSTATTSTITFSPGYNSATNPQARVIRYRMCNNGDFVPLVISTAVTYTYIDNYNAITDKIMAIRTGYIANQYNENETPLPIEEVPNSPLFKIASKWYISRGTKEEKSDPTYFFLPAFSIPVTENMLQWATQLREKYAYNGASYQFGYWDGYQEGFDIGYENGYDTGYEEGLAGVEPVTLDIASIFTSMFNGVHSIFNGFDINIFGISIAGMLLGILLIAVVAFIIKKIK